MKNKCEKSCWWQEGGRCYVFDENTPCYLNGYSKILCCGKCKRYKNKRNALSKVIPNDKLVIVSELM